MRKLLLHSSISACPIDGRGCNYMPRRGEVWSGHETAEAEMWSRTYDPNLMTFWCKTETDIAYVVYVIVMAETAASQTVQQEPEEVHNWLSEARVVSQSHTLTLTERVWSNSHIELVLHCQQWVVNSQV